MTLVEGKFRPTKFVIRQNIENAVRLVCRYFNYSPAECKKMDAFEFLRDLSRSIEMQQHEINTTKKWRNK